MSVPARDAVFAIAALLVGALAGCVVESPPPRRASPPPVPSPAAIDARQRDLEFRIEQGYKTGRITNDEHQLLRRMADDIRRQERQYMNDGQLSVNERSTLGSQLDRLARELDRQLKDTDRR